MSKRHHSQRGNAAHYAKTTAIIILIVVLLVAAACGVCAMGYASRNAEGKWFRNTDLASWHWSDKKEQKQQTWGGVIDNVGNDMNSDTTYAMPTAMAFYTKTSAPLAQQLNMSAPSVTVTCSHNFEFNNVLVDWSVEYSSGADAGDVVTVEPTNDGSLTATLTCLESFSEPLTLKATLRGNKDKTATCRLDFVKRIDNVSELQLRTTDFSDEGGIACKLNFTNGTVNANLKTDVTYWITDEFQEAIKKYLKFDINFISYEAENLELNEYQPSKYYAEDVEWEYSMFIENFDNYDQPHKNAIYYAWLAAWKNGNFKSNIKINCFIDLIYNGSIIDNYKEYDFFSEEYRSFLTGDCYGDIAPDLTLNNNIAF